MSSRSCHAVVAPISAGKLAEVGKGQRLPTELELELARTRKELAEVKMERDLLKKFGTYFAKETR